MQIIEEFIVALDEEIKTLKSGGGGSITKIFNGKLLRKVPNGFIYLFHLENFLASLDDAPAEIEIQGRTHAAQIILTQGLEVEIIIEDYCGEYVAEGKVITNLWYLLELLKKKFNENKANFEISNALFEGNIDKFPKSDHDLTPVFSISKYPPNQSQQHAINSSLKKPLTIIWGPPGTGKTTTIAKVIESHLNAGKKVLLVSHANNAVDQAVFDIAEQMKATPFYNDGQLVRLGTPTDQTLFNEMETKYPLVLMDKIASMLGATLVSEKNELNALKLPIDQQLNEIAEAQKLISNYKTLSENHNHTANAIKEYTNQNKYISEQLASLKAKQNQNQIQMQEAKTAGTFKRVFKGLNPVKIQKIIDQTSIAIDSSQRQFTETFALLREFQNKHPDEEKELMRIDREGKAIFEKLNIATYQELEDKNKNLSVQLSKIQTRLAEIDKQLDELQQSILSRARLVATTLTKTFVDKKFDELQFDVLIVDEASMAPLPYVYWAASKCSSSVTIVGDFLQLPPISISSGEMSKKWLSRSIFEVLSIFTPTDADQNSLVTLLDTQYRMHPEIAEIPKNFFYGGRLKHGTKAQECNDAISSLPLVLVKTDNMNPWCSRLTAGSRFNLYNAILTITLAKKILENGFEGTIGIATPYAAQAKLINKIAKDWNISGQTHISTIHRFQGGEEEIIIFDTVEASGAYIAPMLDSTKSGSTADLLLNVAITRSKAKFYLIAHTEHLYSGLNQNSSLVRLLKYLESHGETHYSEEFVDSYLVTDFDTYSQTPKLTIHRKNDGSLFTEKNFWGQFNEDFNSVKENLIIMSPFLSVRRSSQFMDRLRLLIAKGVKITIFTRPKNQQTGEMVNQSETVIDHLNNIGVRVIERASMHQKVAIIDNRIAWEGSLNILSHRDSGEQMRRFEGEDTIKELIKNLELDQTDGVGNYSDQTCPLCSKHLVVRQSRYGKFLGCSDYPRCKYILKNEKKYTKKSYRPFRTKR